MTIGRGTGGPARWTGLAVGLVLAWCGLLQPIWSGEQGTPRPQSAAVAVTASRPLSDPARAGLLAGAPAVRVAPLSLHLPTLGVQAPVVPADVGPDGGLQVPDDPALVGWWRGGAAAGTGRGSVVLAGHVDTRAAGPGAFFHLSRLRAGETVTLDDSTGRWSYVVVTVRTHPKAELPASTFDTLGQARLVLISCGGTFDTSTRRYSDNVVVHAVPTRRAGSATPP